MGRFTRTHLLFDLPLTANAARLLPPPGDLLLSGRAKKGSDPIKVRRANRRRPGAACSESAAFACVFPTELMAPAVRIDLLLNILLAMH